MDKKAVEEYVAEVVNKVRTMFKYDTKLKGIVTTNPIVEFEYRKDKLVLMSIEFRDYDRLVVSRSCIEFIPDVGNSREIIRYVGFDGLLAL